MRLQIGCEEGSKLTNRTCCANLISLLEGNVMDYYDEGYLRVDEEKLEGIIGRLR